MPFTLRQHGIKMVTLRVSFLQSLHRHCLKVKRAVDGDDVAMRDHLFRGGEVLKIQFLFDGFWETMAVAISEFAVKWLHSAKNREADSSGCDGSDGHAFNIVCTLHAVLNKSDGLLFVLSQG